jgi:hypothetical protein
MPTCGTWLAQAGVDLHQIAGWLRHSNERTTLAVETRRLPDGAPDWEGATAEMLRVIGGLNDPDDTASNGRFKRENREVLDQLRQADRAGGGTLRERHPEVSQPRAAGAV